VLINCDIGERGVAHNVDNQLIRYIDIANIACGGHAGDKQSVNYYLNLAKQHNVKPTAHLSYPDHNNFGRVVMTITHSELLQSLDQQYALINSVKSIKFHGALYHQANTDQALATELAQWLKTNEIVEVLTQENSYLEKACLDQGITILYEAFADRRYTYENDRLTLLPRNNKNALIHQPDEAKEQVEYLKNGYVYADQIKFPIKADTVCIHSDSTNALAIAQTLTNV
jgi:UPF0271 protein